MSRCHYRSSNVLWTIMTQWVLFSIVQGGESGGTHDQEEHTTLICCMLCRMQTNFPSLMKCLIPKSIMATSLLPLSSKVSFFSSVPNQTLSPPHAILKNSPIPFIVFLPNLINMHESSQKFILIIKYSEYILHTRTNKIHSSYITSNTQIWAIKQKKPNYIHLINPVWLHPFLVFC